MASTALTCVWLLGGEPVRVESALPATQPPFDPIVATFSIVGFDPDTGDLGVAVQSKFFGVGTVVPWAKADLGAIATQSYANISYGVDGLGLLARGLSARETLNQLTAADEGEASLAVIRRTLSWRWIVRLQAGCGRPWFMTRAGWENLEVLRKLDGVVDIYLADMKYGFLATAHHAIRGGREHG